MHPSKLWNVCLVDCSVNKISPKSHQVLATSTNKHRQRPDVDNWPGGIKRTKQAARSAHKGRSEPPPLPKRGKFTLHTLHRDELDMCKDEEGQGCWLVVRTSTLARADAQARCIISRRIQWRQQRRPKAHLSGQSRPLRTKPSANRAVADLERSIAPVDKQGDWVRLKTKLGAEFGLGFGPFGLKKKCKN